MSTSRQNTLTTNSTQKSLGYSAIYGQSLDGSNDYVITSMGLAPATSGCLPELARRPRGTKGPQIGSNRLAVSLCCLFVLDQVV
jgi:hypothetical protein